MDFFFFFFFFFRFLQDVFLDVLILIGLIIILFLTVLFIFIFMLPFGHCCLSFTFNVSTIYIFVLFIVYDLYIYNLQPFYACIFIFTSNLSLRYDVTKTVKIKTMCTRERLKEVWHKSKIALNYVKLFCFVLFFCHRNFVLTIQPK